MTVCYVSFINLKILYHFIFKITPEMQTKKSLCTNRVWFRESSPGMRHLKGVFGRHCSPMIDGMQKKIPKEARVEGRTGRITVIRQRSSLSFFCLSKNCGNHIIEMHFVVVLFNPLSIKTYWPDNVLYKNRIYNIYIS